MSGPDTLKQFEGPLKTKMGKAFPGDRVVFRGEDLHLSKELKDATWMDLYVFGITGRHLDGNLLRVLEGMFTCSGYADVRLWNNRVAALASSTRSSGSAALSAALAVSDANIYGGQTIAAASDFLSRTLQRTTAGDRLEDIIREELSHTKRIKGFGRPMATKDVDERLTFTLQLLKRESVEIGEHFKLAFEIERVLSEILKRDLPMTYASVISAVTLDMNFTRHECYLFGNMVTFLGIYPGVVEAMERPEGATFILRCKQLQYNGPTCRQWS